MIAVMPFADKIGFANAEKVGFGTMLLAFSMIYFSIYSYRRNIGGGYIGFREAFVTGIFVVVLSSVFYVAAWLIIYYFLAPGFFGKYAAFNVAQMRADHRTNAEIADYLAQTARYTEMYKNPFINAAIRFTEPLPLGFIITLICSFMLRTKKQPTTPTA